MLKTTSVFLQIQCQVRGFLVREQRADASATATTEETRGKPRHVEAKRRSRAGNRQLDKYLRSVAENQARGGGGGAGEGGGGGGYSEWCGCRIQAWWRMINAR